MRTRTATLLTAATFSLLGATVLTGCGAKDDKDDKSGPAQAATTAPPEKVLSTATVTKPPTLPPGKNVSTAPSTSAPSGRPAGSDGVPRLRPSAQAGGLVRLPDGPSDVPVDPGEVRSPANNVLVAAYGAAGSGPRSVLFVGVDGMTGIDGKRLEHMVRGMVDHVNATEGGVPAGLSMKGYDPGPLGGTLECVPAQDARPAAICGWADRYTTAVAYFDRLSADQAAVKFKAMRADLEK
ncbi:hypothetical protein B4N89_20140 [Embleya scabrispora]|uniref:Lipoprotein n=1 Tax=Embleya scabrispora TaxID=159449 RepID=A0A1T3P1G7_9ACTN|nr:hypothetical protein [Embleya scabrispora]OPC82937.1 hypothetical protein B4N89_20140 [Embleya scabrispora]